MHARTISTRHVYIVDLVLEFSSQIAQLCLFLGNLIPDNLLEARRPQSDCA